jgi:predicted AAA+ superfamily ATPase
MKTNQSQSISRKLIINIQERLQHMPVVAILGPRQVGKTTLARRIVSDFPNAQFLDLENNQDRQVLQEPELFLPSQREKLVVIDEIQFAPEIFRALRPEIDQDRKPGRFLLLGSASGKLLQQSSETLAGRISYQELTPFLINELEETDSQQQLQKLWLRGGYPASFLAFSEESSYLWRMDFMKTLLQRDLPSFGVRVSSSMLDRYWQMLAHLQGSIFNASNLSRSMGMSSPKTSENYLDLLIDAMMVRRLSPFFTNGTKRLVKSPKIYIRDSGILHAMLGIVHLKDLQGHPIVGASWEGFVVEQIANNLPIGAQIFYYRTQAGSELDLVIEKGLKRIVIEIKLSTSPQVKKGFWQAIKDISATEAYVIAPVTQVYKLKDEVKVISPLDFINQVLKSI